MASSLKRPMDDIDEKVEFSKKLIEKLTMNGTLTLEERLFIKDVVTESYEDDDSEDELTESKADKGVQANIKGGKDALTQTIEITHNVESKASTSSEKSPTERLLDETYINRRVYIFTKVPAIIQVKEKYPDLFTASQIRKELDRIFYPGKCNEFLQRLTYYSQVILDETDMDLLQEIARNKIAKAPSEEERNYILQITGILLIPPMFDERMNFVKTEYLYEAERYPYVSANTQNYEDFYVKGLLYTVFVEHIKVAETYDLVEAVLLYFATYYVFDLAFNPRSFNTLCFMDRLFLNINDPDNDEITDQCKCAVELISSKKAPFTATFDWI